ncbi:MAG: cyclodeaminase/cyclohydrolase family protein [Phycisphaerales bacterium]|nr:cyclodeaminase/cyclohydrolase family protein [Planctomycetota bacterium]MCH8509400.1 cyclodeaminase/cyclohydrolase family protein [Phycisphaerales bacterium]
MSQTFADMRLNDLLDALASKCPAPGGGAAAGIVGATAAATAQMVVAYSQGRKSLAEHHSFLDDASGRLTRARVMFLTLADEDAAAYGVLNTLMRLPEDHPDRAAGWAEAVDGAMAPPRATLAAAVELLRLCEELCGKINPNLRSDLGVAGVLGEAAARSAAWNISINLPLLGEDQRGSVRAEAERQAADARARAERIEGHCV